MTAVVCAAAGAIRAGRAPLVRLVSPTGVLTYSEALQAEPIIN